MIRSLRSIRDLSATSSPWIPGRNGPAEPFNVQCFGNDPEVWAAVTRWARSRFMWDCGPFTLTVDARAAGLTVEDITETRVEEATQLFLYRLATITPETWQRLKVGYGDRIRALWAVRAWCRRSGWQEGKSSRSGPRKGAKTRPYRASMSAQPHNPATVAMACERAAEGLTGSHATGSKGRPKRETVTLTPREAYEAIHGTPQRETVVGHVCVSGGIAKVQTDGKIGRIVTRTIVTPETITTVEEWRMVRGEGTRVEYAPCVTADIAELGTERNRYVPQPIPAPRPSGSVYHAAPEWTPDVETYRERLAEYYATR